MGCQDHESIDVLAEQAAEGCEFKEFIFSLLKKIIFEECNLRQPR